MLTNRPPIIVILGHVDHGKTSLLDYLRKTNLTASEAGGITQHIRSFQLVTGNSQLITFVDTPGHAAFSAMRERGSKLADIAILIVSGADGVMPQTVESINFINSQNLPFIVAITKSDLPDFNPDRVKTQLAEHQVFVEDMGGHIPVVSLSIKTGSGISELLEIINLLTELNPPQSDPEAPLECIVLESHLDSQKGPLATVVVTQGTLKVGQDLPAGKIRALIDSDAHSIKFAQPSQPVEILGLNSVPAVGSLLSDKLIASKISQNNPPKTSGEYPIILKADVLGSQEAITWSLPPGISLLSSGTGDVTENDILSASANKAKVVAFNVKCPSSVAKLAEVEKVSVRSFQIIYELLDYLRDLIQKKEVEVITGKAQIIAEFQYNQDHVAGCRVLVGRLNKTDTLRLYRGDNLVGNMKFKSFKTGKTDLVAAKLNTEFGAIFSPALDFKAGDTIIAFTLGHG